MSGSVCRTVRRRRLSSGLPGTTTALPESPPFSQPAFEFQIQTALELFRLRAVALVAVLREHRPDLLFEESDAGRIIGGGGGDGGVAGGR